MTAATLTQIIRPIIQGATYEIRFSFLSRKGKPIPLTNTRLEVRLGYSGQQNVLTLDSDVDTGQFDLFDLDISEDVPQPPRFVVGSGIVVDGAYELNLTSAQTAALPPRLYQIDARLTRNAAEIVVSRFSIAVKGTVYVD